VKHIAKCEIQKYKEQQKELGKARNLNQDKMMKKGLFGCNLANQVIVIGIAFSALSLMGIIFGFLLVSHPEKFSGVQQTSYETMPTGVAGFTASAEEEPSTIIEQAIGSTDTISKNDEIIEGEDLMYNDEIFEEEETTYSTEIDTNTSEKPFEEHQLDSTEDSLEEDIIIEQPIEEQQYLKRLLRHIQGEGVEVLIEGALSLTCSLILLHGVRTNRHWLLLPWLIDTLLEMVAGFLQVSVQAVREQWKMTPGRILGILVFYFLGGYCLYSVASYQVLLRRMNKNSDQIINSVCQGGGFQDLVGGRNYRRLEEEVWQSEPNLGEELRRVQTQEGFSREKKVGGPEQDQDEHVLYIQ